MQSLEKQENLQFDLLQLLHLNSNSKPWNDKFHNLQMFKQMNRENQLLITDEPVQFEEYLVEFQDFMKTSDHCRGNL